MRTPLLAFVVVALAAILTACVTEEQKHLTPTPSGQRTTTLGKALDAADRSACEQYLSQLQQTVQMYSADHDGKFPPDIAAVIKEAKLESVTKDCHYTYDASTGKVGLVR
jgi:hypothetical protein